MIGLGRAASEQAAPHKPFEARLRRAPQGDGSYRRAERMCSSTPAVGQQSSLSRFAF
jgi:hypothetical protein